MDIIFQAMASALRGKVYAGFKLLRELAEGTANNPYQAVEMYPRTKSSPPIWVFVRQLVPPPPLKIPHKAGFDRRIHFIYDDDLSPFSQSPNLFRADQGNADIADRLPRVCFWSHWRRFSTAQGHSPSGIID